MDRVLLIDKPAGRTSHDLVAEVRRGVGGPRKGPGVVRVGHAGTLDPFATGLLLVLIGRATKAQSLFMGLRKTYEVTARFGAVSSTGDTEGEITETGVLPSRPLVLPTGLVRQRPPAYSAIKIDGERAYARARRGEEVEMPEREVTVYRFEPLPPAGGSGRPDDEPGADERFLIECSSGTYVRSLVADLGDAYCTSLRRTAIGPFDVTGSADHGTVETGIPLGEALGRVLPVVPLEGAEAGRAAHGVAVADPRPDPAGARVLIVDADGPVAVAEPRPGGLLKPVVGFRS
ncbi:tRNA pseudouridine(55) synthase TruB [Paraconexibacter antarcticus]|uniref:tRNA pseudouridine synthase B n=1 Tax=Paraconexibacter antarcticus TaxID=2949664 RepID=A0ABY5DNJ7_9ACTN|nr:tRNA pseudouridine(55) synthase TruB [Paraconexibacter antarcticus]UTI62758.1 tRNA pseudouridine(55) synthase TruB [Paraconexibacter antarcticus]